MLVNRSMPRSAVIPELAYPDVGKAIGWLCDAYGFTLRLRIGDHRAQINAQGGAFVITRLRDGSGGLPAGAERSPSVMVRVEDADAHYRQALAHGAEILTPPADHPYGERQYTSRDLAGHIWKFSQSIADVAPEAWGGTSGEL